MWIFLDLSVILIILISVIISAKRGFVRTAVEAVGFIAAVFIAFTFSNQLANLTYEKVIEPPVISAVCEGTAETAVGTADAIWDAMPEILTKNADKFGFSKDKIVRTVDENASESIENIARNTVSTVLKPVVIKLLSALYSVIITVVLLIVVKFAARFLNGLFSFSIVGQLNRTLGGVVGIVKGVVIAVLYCVAVAFIVSLTTGGIFIFTNKNIADSYLFGYFASILI